MTHDLSTPRTGVAGTSATRALLAGGVVAGPLFIVVGLLQAYTRDGFDLRRHPLSLLSNGDLGWIQITTFVVTGLLFAGTAVGMRRVLHPGRGGTWGPLLVGAVGGGDDRRRDLRRRPGRRLPARDTAGSPRHSELAQRAALPGRRGGVPVADRGQLRVRPPVRRARPAGLGVVLAGDRRGLPGRLAGPVRLARAGPGQPGLRGRGAAWLRMGFAGGGAAAGRPARQAGLSAGATGPQARPPVVATTVELGSGDRKSVV